MRAGNGGTTVLSPDTTSDYVVTPGGPRKRSLVHQIEPGQIVRVDAGNWHILDRTGKIVKDITPEPPVERVPGFGQGWITNAFWNNNTASAISLLSTTWTVPPPPRTQDGQLVYLFNGIQTNVVSNDPNKAGIHILQPVLQWGASPDGGGNNWAIASWFAGNQNQPASKTPLVSAVQTGNTPPALSWTASDNVTDCGQYTLVVSNATPGGEVDLFYGYNARLGWQGDLGRYHA